MGDVVKQSHVIETMSDREVVSELLVSTVPLVDWIEQDMHRKRDAT